MWLDITELRDFYLTGLGQTVRRILRRRVRSVWPDVRGQRVLGVGFAVPFLSAFRDEAERVVAVMPAGQGVMPWPPVGRGLVALSEDGTLPFADCSFDRIVVCHAVEHSEQPRQFLRELWRVLTDGGHVVVIVPNRQGLWTHSEKTPFASGQPYSARQLCRLLGEAMLTPERVEHALFMPPAGWRAVRAWAWALEQVGQRWCPALSGVVLVEACKQIYVAPTSGATASDRARSRRYLPLPEGFRRRQDRAPSPPLRHEAPE